MYYTDKIQKAINFAIKVHQIDRNQTRKGKIDPYIIHPLSVGIILARTGAEEDVVVAGILHDTIEDSIDKHKITKEIIEKEFGSVVGRILDDVTEKDKNLPWIERKLEALEHIKNMNQDSILVKSADVLHNLRDQISDYKIEGDKMFKRFNKQASKKMQLTRYQKLIKELEKYWHNNPLLPELKSALIEVESLWR